MRFLKDIPIGEEVDLGNYTFSEEEIIRFGEKYDRQDYHIDPELAKGSVFGGIIASGWHTTAIYMKLQVAYFQSEEKRYTEAGRASSKFSASPGLEDIKWLGPVHAGDTISYSSKVTAKRPLKSRAGWGLMTLLTEARNQNGNLILTMSGYSIMQWENETDCD